MRLRYVLPLLVLATSVCWHQVSVLNPTSLGWLLFALAFTTLLPLGLGGLHRLLTLLERTTPDSALSTSHEGDIHG